MPPDCLGNVVIIGSLAAGYHFFGNDLSKAVRTKDVDCVLEPFHAAVGVGQHIAQQLMDAGWQRRMAGNHQKPGDDQTPDDQLPAVRLYPPQVNPDSEESWFIELLTVPQSAETKGKTWTRLQLKEGHFGLPAFRFLIITAHDPLPAGAMGLRYARPEMMALANLLEHPKIGLERMRGLFAGRAIKRSNKDLGRVLAIATLAALDDYSPWTIIWQEALQTCFPNEWRQLALRVGAGLHALLHSETDLEEAQHTCNNGLLASQPASINSLRATGERLLGDAIEVLETVARARN
ncbi:MAG: hypothetical protein U0984_12655 [Prosthecobacter sp.]|nr:hypothetical protein [Prosthecobacter sp.]